MATHNQQQGGNRRGIGRFVRIGSAAAFVGLAASAGVGCADSHGGYRDRDRVDRVGRADRVERVERVDRVEEAGHTTEGGARRNVPRDAQLVAEDRGGVTFRAPDDGHIWVTESTYDEVLFDAPVRRGSDFTLDAKRDRGFFDGREILQGRLKNDIRYRVYYARDRR